MELNSHTRGQSNEIAAFNKAKPSSASTKQKILTEIASCSMYGVTPDEFIELNGGLINTVRRRFTDLWKEGKIKKNGLSRDNAAGNATSAWVLGRDEGIDNVPIVTLNQRIVDAYQAGYRHGFAAGEQKN